MSSPFLGYPVFSWPAAPFGLLYTFAAGSSTPKSTYSDKDNLVPNVNPVMLDATGTATVRLGTGAYKFVLLDQSNTVTLWTADYYDPLALTAAAVGAVVWPQSAAEVLATVTPSNYGYIWGDPRRYGAVLDGITDDTAALQAWASIPGEHIFPGSLTALITTAIPMVSHSTFRFSDGATILTAGHDINMFVASGKTDIAISGAHFRQTSVGTVSKTGGISLTLCTDCLVENCEFEGMQFAGVFMSDCTRSSVRGNYIHDSLGQIQTSADVYCEAKTATSSSYNVITGNFCFGGTLIEFGIAVWDPYTGFLPTHNIVSNNRIGAHNGYGILGYYPSAGESYNQFIGNHIQDISAWAGPGPNTDSGAGIYIVGAGSGGTQIIGNTINNCCITTTTTSLAPGGIGISGTSVGSVPIVVQGNIIEGMTKYWGILLTGVNGGAVVSGNTVRMPSTNTTGDAIRVTNSTGVTVANNVITQLNTTTAQRCILVFAQGVNCNEVVVSNNSINGGHLSQIETQQTGGFLVAGVTISGNTCFGGDNSCIPLLINNASAAEVLVTGNFLSGGNATVVSQTGCIDVRYANNRLKGTGTAILTTSGVCTGSFYDISNFGTGTGAGVVNGATGLIVEQLGTAAPVAGTWAVGDMVRNSAPSAAGTFIWVTTTAGAGTWKVIANS